MGPGESRKIVCKVLKKKIGLFSNSNLASRTCYSKNIAKTPIINLSITRGNN